jgi:hypothetical protein
MKQVETEVVGGDEKLRVEGPEGAEASDGGEMGGVDEGV